MSGDTRVFAFGEDSFALPLTIKLYALFGENVNRILLRKARALSPKQKDTFRCPFVLEATPGFEPGDRGVADLCLTTWPCRLMSVGIFHRLYYHIPSREYCCKEIGRDISRPFFWSGLRGSNPPPSPWQGDALPNELSPHVVPPVGIEPTTRGFSVLCSTN